MGGAALSIPSSISCRKCCPRKCCPRKCSLLVGEWGGGSLNIGQIENEKSDSLVFGLSRFYQVLE